MSGKERNSDLEYKYVSGLKNLSAVEKEILVIGVGLVNGLMRNGLNAWRFTQVGGFTADDRGNPGL